MPHLQERETDSNGSPGTGTASPGTADNTNPPGSIFRRTLNKVTNALPNVFLAYERLCVRIATRGYHEIPYFASTAFMAPIGIGIWNARSGGFLRRLLYGLAAWLVLGLGLLAFIYGGFLVAIVLLPLSRWLAADRDKPSLRRRVFALVLLSCIPLPIIVAGMPGAGGFAVWPGVTGTNAAMLVALHRSEPDYDFEELAEFIEEAIEPERFPFSDRPPWPDGKRDPRTYNDYMKSEDYANLKVRIVHIGAEARTDKWGSKYFGDRIVAATGCRVDTGGWGPEVWSELMREEVEKSRREDPRCLFAYQKKDGFTDEEVRQLVARHRLDWTRRFGKQYLVGGRGLAGSLETF